MSSLVRVILCFFRACYFDPPDARCIGNLRESVVVVKPMYCIYYMVFTVATRTLISVYNIHCHIFHMEFTRVCKLLSCIFITDDLKAFVDLWCMHGKRILLICFRFLIRSLD